MRPDSDGGWDFGYNPSSGDGIVIDKDGIATIDGDDIISIPEFMWDDSDVDKIDLEGGGEVEIHDDHISINDDHNNSIINIDHEGIRVDLDGGWEAVVDISDGTNNGVNIHHKDPNAEWPSYQIDIGADGQVVVKVLDKDGDLIQVINQKPDQIIELPLYGGTGESIVIDLDGTVHMPGPGGDAIAKPNPDDGTWDFGQTPPDGDGGIIIDNDGIHHGPDFDDVISIPDWIWDEDGHRPDGDRPDRPDRPS